MKNILASLLFIFILNSSFATTYTVTNTNPTGSGSLIAAIDSSNTFHGSDSIIFNIPGMPPHVIPLAVTSSISIVDTIIIDGTTQPDNGYTGSCPKIVLDAAGVNPAVTILIHISAPYVSINGLWIKNFTASGSDAVLIDAPDVSIGAPGKKNVFTNVYNSIELLNNGINISSNYFGCNCDGTALDINAGIAIFSYAGFGNQTITDNLISGNSTGIDLGNTGSLSSNIIIRGNKIGTDISGTIALGNTGRGINLVNLSALELGGAAVSEGNLVSGNGTEGCRLIACSGNVLGNKIGTDITGNDTLPNNPLNLNYNTAFNCNGYSGLICTLTVGGSTSGEQNIFFGNNIAFNIADSSGYYQLVNNLIGQTSSGLVSPNQLKGFQLYYDTNEVYLDSNHIYGSTEAFYATQCINFISTNNILGSDINGNNLSLANGYSLDNANSFSIYDNLIRNCSRGIFMRDCNESVISNNTISDCSTPLIMRSSTNACHHNQLDRNKISFNTYTIDLSNGTINAANDDIHPPVILGSNADSTWGTSLPNAGIDLCYDTTLIPLYPQGYRYPVARFYADISGNWVYPNSLNNPGQLTAVQTDVNNNASGFSDRLPLGISDPVLNTFHIYPNPAEDYFILENVSGTKWNNWQLLNLTGSIVSEGNFTHDSKQQIDMRNLAPGCYFLKVTSSNNNSLFKVLKQ